MKMTKRKKPTFPVRGPYSKKKSRTHGLATIRQIEADIFMMERALKNARALHRALLKVYR